MGMSWGRCPTHRLSVGAMGARGAVGEGVEVLVLGGRWVGLGIGVLIGVHDVCMRVRRRNLNLDLGSVLVGREGGPSQSV